MLDVHAQELLELPADCELEAVSDEGLVRARLPDGRVRTAQVPLEQVPRLRHLLDHALAPGPR